MTIKVIHNLVFPKEQFVKSIGVLYISESSLLSLSWSVMWSYLYTQVPFTKSYLLGPLKHKKQKIGTLVKMK